MYYEDYEYEKEINEQVIDETETDESIPFSYSLTSYGIDFDVNGLVRRFRNNSILVPDFQRNLVWSSKQCSKFIESILLGIPIPGIFLSVQENTNNLLVIDGQQRLNALFAFYEGRYKQRNFKLIDVHSDYLDLTYETLPQELKNKVDDTIIHATIVKPEDPKDKNNESIFLIFERLNSGGMNLYPQEIRTAIYQGQFQELLVELKELQLWKENFSINPKRKKDEEIILRLIALHYNYKNYKGNMKFFLNEFMSNNKNLESVNKNEIKEIFTVTLNYICNEIGLLFFRPKGNALNIAILDSIFVGISRNVEHIDNDKKNIKEVVSSINEDEKFKNSIFTGKTHHKESVISRIDIAIEKIYDEYRN